MKKEIGLMAVCALLIVGMMGFVSAAHVSGLVGNPIEFQVNYPSNEMSSKILRIYSADSGQLDVNIIDVPAVSLKESVFNVIAGESSEIEVFLDATKTLPGVSVGSVEFSDKKGVFDIPLVVKTEKDVFYGVDSEVSPQYEEVNAGDKIVFQVKVIDLTQGFLVNETILGPGIVDMEYYLYDSSGKILSSETERLIVDKHIQVSKSFLLPSGVSSGQYVFAVVAKYKDSVAVDAGFFKVIEKEKKSFIEGIGWVYLAVIAGIIIFFIILIILFLDIIKQRDKMIIELERYNSWEGKHYKKLLKEQVKIAKEKKVANKKSLFAEVKEKWNYLKFRHKARKQHFIELKKLKKVGVMEQKLMKLIGRGYEDVVEHAKLSFITKEDFSKIVSGLKSKVNYFESKIESGARYIGEESKIVGSKIGQETRLIGYGMKRVGSGISYGVKGAESKSIGFMSRLWNKVRFKKINVMPKINKSAKNLGQEVKVIGSNVGSKMKSGEKSIKSFESKTSNKLSKIFSGTISILSSKISKLFKKEKSVKKIDDLPELKQPAGLKESKIKSVIQSGEKSIKSFESKTSNKLSKIFLNIKTIFKRRNRAENKRKAVSRIKYGLK